MSERFLYQSVVSRILCDLLSFFFPLSLCQSLCVEVRLWVNAGATDCGFEIAYVTHLALPSCSFAARSFHLQQSQSLFPAVTSSHDLPPPCPSSHFLARQETSCPRGVLLIGGRGGGVEVWVDKDTPVSTRLDSVFPLSLLLNGAPKLRTIKKNKNLLKLLVHRAH